MLYNTIPAAPPDKVPGSRCAQNKYTWTTYVCGVAACAAFVCAFAGLSVFVQFVFPDSLAWDGFVPSPPCFAFLNSSNGELNVTLLVSGTKVSYHHIGKQGQVEFVARTYNESSQVPVFRVEPGDVFRVLVVNQLGGAEDVNASATPNTLRFPNHTSLHTHGLHVSPVGNADNVLVDVPPGHSREYVYRILPSHPPGTFWVHPHLHGSAALQTAYSMVGVLIVDDVTPTLRNLDETILVLQNLNIGTSSGRSVQHLNHNSHSFIGTDLPGDLDVDVVLCNGRLGPIFYKHNVDVTRARIVNAAIDGAIVLSVDERSGRRGTKAVLWQISADGVYLATPRSKRFVIIPPGSRADILVEPTTMGGFVRLISGLDHITKATSDPDVLHQKDAIQAFLGAETTVLRGPVATFAFRGKPFNHEGLRVELQRAPRHNDNGTKIMHELTLPTYPYGNLVDEPSVPSARTFVFRWTSPGKGTPKLVENGIPYSFYGVNGERFSGDAVVKVKLNEVQEWTIVNDVNLDGSVAVESHPFHMHTNHFQVVGSTFPEHVDFAIGDWRDTISCPSPGNVTIRWKPQHFVGKSLAHCHILLHEDVGMMLAFEIVE